MESLKDPLGDRIVKTIKGPPYKPLPSSQIWDKPSDSKTPNWKKLRDHLKREGKLLKTDIFKIIKLVSDLFKKEGNLVHVNDPITVVGDIHGQYYDLLKLLNVGGNPE